MNFSNLRRAAHWAILAALFAGSTACGSQARDAESTPGGESHFLKLCVNDCDNGLECVAGACTQSCTADSMCTTLLSDATCDSAGDDKGYCDVACQSNPDCGSLGDKYNDKYTCAQGVCRSDDSDTSVEPEPSQTDEASCRVAFIEYPSGSTGIPASVDCEVCSCDDGELDCAEPPGSFVCVGTPIIECPENIQTDDVNITGSSFDESGPSITLDVNYGTGCARHDFALCYSRLWAESYPVQISFELIHDSHGESCEGGAIEQLTFALDPLVQAYNDAYLTEGGIISTNYGRFSFGELSCFDRRSQAEYLAFEALESADRTCETADDCVMNLAGVGCRGASCGTVLSIAGDKEYSESVGDINGAYCTDTASQCEVLESDDCPSIARSPRCDAGRCEG